MNKLKILNYKQEESVISKMYLTLEDCKFFFLFFVLT